MCRVAREDWESPLDGGAVALGERVRLLRRSAGLSQAELAGGRFSKEYVSQIERGKTRPTRETLEWLAGRLETDTEYLEHGLNRADTERLEADVRAAEGLLEAHRYEDALAAFRASRQDASTAGSPALGLRIVTGEAWALVRTGELEEAMFVLEAAASASVSGGLTDVDRAEVVFLVGVVRYHESRIAEAITLLDQALVLAEGSAERTDRLRSDIFHWRARCHRRDRDWVAAEEDIDRALELAEAIPDARRAADALFQGSLVAQRQGRWVLARTYAERSRDLFAEIGDRATVARLLNNLAGLNHLLGSPDRSIELLEEAFEIFVDLDLRVDAGYVCSSLAEIRLDLGQAELAEAQAHKALDLLEDRADHLQEVGTAELVLGRSLATQGRLEEAEEWIARAEATSERASSASHRSSAWLARGDLESLRGDDVAAAGLYRRAARALQESEV
jgi:tetratricopeptide (TPR) repeat protein